MRKFSVERFLCVGLAFRREWSESPTERIISSCCRKREPNRLNFEFGLGQIQPLKKSMFILLFSLQLHNFIQISSARVIKLYCLTIAVNLNRNCFFFHHYQNWRLCTRDDYSQCNLHLQPYDEFLITFVVIKDHSRWNLRNIIYDPAIYNLFLERSVQVLHSVVVIVEWFIGRTAKW